MAEFLQYVLNGLAKGSIYSLIALGLVVIYLGVSWLVPNSYYQLILTLVPIWACGLRTFIASVKSAHAS